MNQSTIPAPVIMFAFLFRKIEGVAQPHVFLDERYNRVDNSANPSTREISRAHLWKTRAGGERWIAARASQKFNNSQIIEIRVHANGLRQIVNP